MRTEQIGDATLYCGDARDCLETVTAAVLITDPPYGLSGSTKKAIYDTDLFEDTPEYLEAVIVPTVAGFLERTQRGAVSCGIPNVWRYPPGYTVGGLIYPSVASWCAWGSPTLTPILLYGKRPKTKPAAPLHTMVYSSASDGPGSHPCPKPPVPWRWLVERCTNPGETVIDPFMGSGVTGSCCADLGLPFIGIEIEPKYFDIACERITAAYAQGRLFA